MAKVIPTSYGPWKESECDSETATGPGDRQLSWPLVNSVATTTTPRPPGGGPFPLCRQDRRCHAINLISVGEDLYAGVVVLFLNEGAASALPSSP